MNVVLEFSAKNIGIKRQICLWLNTVVYPATSSLVRWAAHTQTAFVKHMRASHRRAGICINVSLHVYSKFDFIPQLTPVWKVLCKSMLPVT